MGAVIRVISIWISLLLLTINLGAKSLDKEIIDAIYAESPARVESLLKQKPELVSAKPEGKSLLHHALETENQKIVLSLIQLGCSLDMPNKNGNRPLAIAAAHGFEEVVSALLQTEQVNINAQNRWQETALVLAISYSKPDAAKVLIMQGADVNLAAQHGSPLHYAIGWNQVVIVEALVAAGAEPNNNKYRKSKTPLHLAVAKEMPRTFSALAQANVDYAAVDQNLRTAIMHAMKHAPEHYLETLYKKGCSVDARDINGASAMSYAGWSLSEYAVNWLENKGLNREELIPPSGWMNKNNSRWASNGISWLALIPAFLDYADDSQPSSWGGVGQTFEWYRKPKHVLNRSYGVDGKSLWMEKFESLVGQENKSSKIKSSGARVNKFSEELNLHLDDPSKLVELLEFNTGQVGEQSQSKYLEVWESALAIHLAGNALRMKWLKKSSLRKQLEPSLQKIFKHCGSWQEFIEMQIEGAFMAGRVTEGEAKLLKEVFSNQAVASYPQNVEPWDELRHKLGL